MSTHYVNPNDEPRACSVCNGTKRAFPMLESAKPAYGPCNVCNGTGRLGNPEARPECRECYGTGSGRTGRLGDRCSACNGSGKAGPEIEVSNRIAGTHGTPGEPRWRWRRMPRGKWSEPYPTEALAVAAARKVLGGKS